MIKKTCIHCKKEFETYFIQQKLCNSCRLVARQAPRRTRNDLATPKMMLAWNKFVEGIKAVWWPKDGAAISGPGMAGWLLGVGFGKPITIGFFRNKKDTMVTVQLGEAGLVFSPRCYAWKFKRTGNTYIDGWMKAEEDCPCSACLASRHLTRLKNVGRMDRSTDN